MARQVGDSMKLYTVYNNNTDELVIVDGTPDECAKAMGIKRRCFYSVLNHVKTGHTAKWNIEARTIPELSPEPTFGEKVVYHRTRLNISRNRLSEVTGISYTALTHYELCLSEPCISYAARIADALGLSLDYLAGIKTGGE